MKPPSPALSLAWQLGGTEAVLTRHEFIQPEHLLLGLFKLQTFSGSVARLRRLLGEDNRLQATSEISALMDLFSRHQIDPTAYRRALRSETTLKSKLPLDRRAEEIHRSPASRQAFERAHGLAEQQGLPATTCFHLLAALLEPQHGRCREWLGKKGVRCDALREDALELARGLEAPRQKPAVPQAPPAAPAPPLPGGSLLARYGRDLTRLAAEGKLHEAIARKGPILQVVRTLSRETKNNPVLIGEPGVGKTAIVEGLAWRIAQGGVAKAMRGKRIIQINIADLVAGTILRGDFEERLQALVREVASSPDVMLFIDEIHTIVGAGSGGTGALDAANILKPALARGDLRCIAATTITDYRKYIEKDPALERRFQPITIDELGPEDALRILAALQPRFADRHQVRIGAGALEAAVSLSVRYLPDRRLPDKAIDLLDEACARAQIVRLTVSPQMPSEQAEEVSADLVARVISEWTGIPVAQLTGDESERLLRMGDSLKERIIGQDQAVEAVAAAVQRARAGIKDPGRPISVMLFMGPTGTGKTELARATARFLFGTDKAMVRLDMTEFMERHSVSRLIGSPPGYVGYEEEGQLTGALRRSPYSVIVLDEVEKAHPEVLNLFLQVFDAGRLTDSKGRTADASNALFIMTSNLGFTRALGFRTPKTKESTPELPTALRASFTPEFINRIEQMVMFRPLDKEDLGKIARLMLDELGGRLAEKGLRLEATDEAMHLLVEESCDERSGARPLRRAMERRIEDALGALILRGEAQPGETYVLEARDGELMMVRKVDRRPGAAISQEYPRPRE